MMTAMNAEATETGAGVEELGIEAFFFVEVGQEAGREAGIVAGVEGAEGGVGQMAEKIAADEIVGGHQYHE